MSSEHKKPTKRFYIICFAATLAVILLLLMVFLHQRAAVAPVQIITVEGLDVSTPADAQAVCRAEHEKCAELTEGNEDCVWAWCGDDRLFLLRPDALRLEADSDDSGFTAVSFKDENGKRLEGYIIDPVSEPNELGRIQLDAAEEYTFDSVSMSVRVALRKGEISFENAIYIWEKGSYTVFAVSEDKVDVVEGNIVFFTDDGGTARVCYILDTKLD